LNRVSVSSFFLLLLEYKIDAMKFLKIMPLLVVLCALASCDRLSPGETKSTAPVLKKIINVKLSSLATNMDLVCQMPLKDGDIADTANYQNKVYGFCSSECKQNFSKNPGEYVVAP
jgi:YHS domain-containing protein